MKYKIGDGSLERLSMTTAMQAMLNHGAATQIESNKFIKLTDRNLPPLHDSKHFENGEDMIRFEKKIIYQEGKIDMVNHS